MQLLTLGLNHQTAPVAVRERVAFGGDALVPALRDLLRDVPAVREAAILSTCNRTEIYCGQADPSGAQNLRQWLSHHSGCETSALADNLYCYPDERAVSHAFRVASGLDSMVLGEPQILGQMKHAFYAATDAGTTGKVLNRLFQDSFSVAKQVRTDTAIGANSVSVARTGVNLAKRVFSDLGKQRTLLIGAGETIELVARHLRQNGVRDLCIANRSTARAQQLATRVDGETITLAQIPENLRRADIVVSATASTLPILGKGAIERALAQRKHKPMFILDLAVPRDVEPQASELPDAYLYTVDDLQKVVAQHRSLRADAAEEASALIELQAARFMRWMRTLTAIPAIRALREKLESVAEAELQRAAKRIQNGEDPLEVNAQLARSLCRKFAHQPSRVLQDAARDGNSELNAAVRKLFEL